MLMRWYVSVSTNILADIIHALDPHRLRYVCDLRQKKRHYEKNYGEKHNWIYE